MVGQKIPSVPWNNSPSLNEVKQALWKVWSMPVTLQHEVYNSAFAFTSCLKSLSFCHSFGWCLDFSLGHASSPAHACGPLDSKKYLGALTNPLQAGHPSAFPFVFRSASFWPQMASLPAAVLNNCSCFCSWRWGCLHRRVSGQIDKLRKEVFSEAPKRSNCGNSLEWAFGGASTPFPGY